ncbi:putative ATP-dependent RNA helicase [Leptomonas pyrrhocoris]|uniref:ATP-dependent RNA helicase n=1 Tax=Leptomonas pyrrhocoris TaxID=157538 RepID=A0A0M9G8G6_LEPPY|nr:putative ATP-dependent RNA helicase [Leptomonas pyrrhocoris]KPA84803.1 putative ATP-dependent RNA helicase [Leptomonas pyrrhocoris]|eukprot:XP_015663242.1 putative ATP-dependent RNA helicase [Leptomonas pyrrhocoris]
MGTRGRRRKLREREAQARQQQTEDAQKGYGSDEDDDDDADEVVTMGNGPFQPPVDAMGRLKMKKNDFFRMQDAEVLEQMQEEHQTRRQQTQSGVVVVGGASRKRGRHRSSGRAEPESAQDVAAATARDYLGHDYDHADLFGIYGGNAARATLSSSSSSSALQANKSEKRRRPGKDGNEGRGGAVREGAATSVDSAGSLVEAENELLEQRRRAAHGALFNHPLIGLDAVVVGALQQEGFHRMTRIQERSIPYALEGYDLLGQACTGSGKTLAFCVPLLHMAKNTIKKYPHATVGLILAPTKELCVQTHTILTTLCKNIAAVPASDGGVLYHVQLITGGTKMTEERRQLTSGVSSIVVGTPGRIHEHVVHCKGWDLSRLRLLVLDEADRMLAEGFQRDLDAVISRIPKGRQTFLFSATNSKSVRELARLSLSRLPLFISTSGSAPSAVDTSEGGTAEGNVASAKAQLPPYRLFNDPESEDEAERADTAGNEEEEERQEDEPSDRYSDDAEGKDNAIPSSLRQFGHIVPSQDRLRALYTFVKQVARRAKAMVFCSTVASATFHCQMMGSVGFHDDVMMLHGHMKHRQRVQAFQVFTDWKTGVLFCTDVAARGLDIPHVSWILQYDPPLDPTEYIHRIGRTARAGSVGNSLLFLTPEEAPFLRYLASFDIHLQKYPMPERLPRIQEKFEHVLQLDEVVAKSAVTAYRAHIGAYQSHILKETFDVHKLDLEALSKAFALTAVPHVTLPRNTEEEKRKEYVKGKLKSLNRRRLDALRHYEMNKTRPQWEEGSFIGVRRPSLN